MNLVRAGVAALAMSAAAGQLTGCEKASDPTPAPTATEHPEAQLIGALKEQVASDLKDPSSAQFRNLTLYQTTLQFNSGRKVIAGRRVLCGEVNAKNALGGYVGFRPFVAWLVVASETGLIREDSRYTAIEAPKHDKLYELFIETQNDACRNKLVHQKDVKTN